MCSSAILITRLTEVMGNSAYATHAYQIRWAWVAYQLPTVELTLNYLTMLMSTSQSNQRYCSSRLGRREQSKYQHQGCWRIVG